MRDTTKELLELNGTTVIVQMAMYQVLRSLLPEEEWSRSEEILSNIDYDALLEDIGAIYENVLTESDVVYIIAFNKSDVGRKMQEYSPQLTNGLLGLGKKYGVLAREAFESGKTTFHYIDFDGEEEGDEG